MVSCFLKSLEDFMDWKTVTEIAAIVGGIATLLAMFLGPMFYLGSKIDSFRKEVHQDMNEFRKESKDFHGRLCAIEEKIKK